MNWEIGIDIYALICIKWMNNKNLLYKKIKRVEVEKKRKKDILELKYKGLGNKLDVGNKEETEDAIIKQEIHLKILKFKV